MYATITPSKISGTIATPPSKSATHRAIIIASLAKGESIIENPLFSDDTNYTIEALRKFGVDIKKENNKLIIKGTGGKLITPNKPIFVGNSGSTLRMLTAVSILASGKTIITGEKRLKERPMGDLLDALQQKGIRNGGQIKIRGDISSQYITALLLIAPFAKETVTIVIEGDLRSKPYVSLTIDLMKLSGVHVINNNFKKFIVEKGQTYIAKDYFVEGDYSSASYFFGAAAITKSSVTVKNLRKDSKQADAYMLDILKKMGCQITQTIEDITVTGNDLVACDIDMNNCPDIVQTVAVVAAYANGKTTITNIGHLKDKETNRLLATAMELKKMNIQVVTTNDSLIITGGKPHGAIIETHNDHRMAMSFAIAGLGAFGKTTIQNADVVNKSYPHFWKDLKKIGGNVSI